MKGLKIDRDLYRDTDNKRKREVCVHRTSTHPFEGGRDLGRRKKKRKG